MDRWRCGQTTCPQQNGFCYLIDGVHLRLMPQHLKTWSIAINDGNGDLETAPSLLARTLMPSKPSLKNPLREILHKTPAKEPHLMQSTPQTPSPFLQSYPPPPPYYHPYLNNLPQYPQLPSPYMYPPQPHTLPDVPQRAHQRSSSLPSEFEYTMDKLDEYFTWLFKIAPSMKEQLTECLAILKRRDIVLDTLPSVTDAHYERWETEGDNKVSDGVRLLIVSHLKKWKCAKAKGRA